jgi:DNA-binding transcriptional regulator WhiA
VEAIRAELAAIEPARACCWRAERLGLGRAAEGRARSPAVARLAARLAAREGATRPAPDDRFEWDGSPDHCRIAWLRGRFLAHGSLSLATGTHLELVLDAGEAGPLSEHLARAGIEQRWRLRRGRGVIVWKGREAVLELLRRLGASASVLELESQGAATSLRGQLNRALNAETSNLLRSVSAGARQAAAIDRLDRAGELDRLAAFDRRVATLRRAEPGVSLSELAERLDTPRGRVQRALERIEAAADRHDVAAERLGDAGGVG